MQWLRARRAAHLRGAGPDRPGLRRALRVRGHPHHRRRADRAGPPPAPDRACSPRWASTSRSTTNGVKLARDGPRPRRRRAAAHQRVARLAPPRDASSVLTRRDELDRVLAGIDAALDAGLDPVKVNCVVIRGVNDDEVVDLAAFGRDQGVGVRFIEFMPLDADGDWTDGPGRPRPGDPRPRRRRLPARRRRGARRRHVEPAARYRYRGRRAATSA